MKVLYLSYDGLTDPLGQSQVLPYLIGLCKDGHLFHIVSFEKPLAFTQQEETIRELIADHSITWHPEIYHKRPPILSTLLDLWKMWRHSKKLIGTHNIALVHARSYLAGLIGLRLKKKYRLAFLFDIRGFWADERVDGELWSLNNPIYYWVYNYFKGKEIEMMQGADHIISLTHAGKAEIVSGNLFGGKAKGLPPEKITVIPCAVDLELFDPCKISVQDQARLRKQLALAEAEHVLVYLGSLGTWYLLEEMLMYFKQIQKEDKNSVFLFVTRDDPTMILAAADQQGIDRKMLRIASASREEVPLYLSLGSLGIFFIKPAYSKKASSATKMGEMMAMELDIVCNEIGDIQHFNSQRETPVNNLNVLLIKSDECRTKIKAFSLNDGIENYEAVYKKISLQ